MADISRSGAADKQVRSGNEFREYSLSKVASGIGREPKKRQFPTKPASDERSIAKEKILARVSATNPENGTVTYTYNTDGTLATKTDAKNQQVQYTYDTLKRVTTIQRGTLSGGVFNVNTAQQTTLTYDTATGCANGQGRLCQAQYTGTNADAGSGLQNDSYTDTYSYSAPGEVTASFPLLTSEGRLYDSAPIDPRLVWSR